MEFGTAHLHALELDAWFTRLPEELRKQLIAIGSVRRVAPRQTLFERGQPGSGVYCLLEGTVLVMNEAEPGHDSVLGLLDPPAWFGETGLFDDGPHTHTVVSGTESTVLYLPRTLLLRLLDESPQYWRCFSLLLTAKLRLSFFLFDDSVKTPLEVRFARRLLLKAAGMGIRTAYRPSIDIHQKEMAEVMGVGRSSLNPLLGNLAKRGLVRVEYGRITILDLDGIKELAGFHRWAGVYRSLLAGPVADPSSAAPPPAARGRR